jgi:hypothetical protein
VELAERGITSIVFDPCGNRPTEGSWLAVMQTNATHLERVAESIAAES